MMCFARKSIQELTRGGYFNNYMEQFMDTYGGFYKLALDCF